MAAHQGNGYLSKAGIKRASRPCAYNKAYWFNIGHFLFELISIDHCLALATTMAKH
ncbi:MAG: hypothetical protein HYZ16_09620 [Bacteroidetes bacterium]|nr:hypothetical protein [Bacteroidota bacterium]